MLTGQPNHATLLVVRGKQRKTPSLPFSGGKTTNCAAAACEARGGDINNKKSTVTHLDAIMGAHDQSAN